MSFVLQTLSNILIEEGKEIGEMILSPAAQRDAELVAGIKAGDSSALDRLVAQYFLPTQNRVRCFVPVDDVDDVTQDIFLGLVRFIHGFNGKAPFGAWFSKLVMNRVAEYHRREFRRKDRFIPEEQLSPDCGAWLREIEGVEINDLLSKLSKRYREVLFLKFLEGLSMVEIAGRLGLTYEAARSRYRRGIEFVHDLGFN